MTLINSYEAFRRESYWESVASPQRQINKIIFTSISMSLDEMMHRTDVYQRLSVPSSMRYVSQSIGQMFQAHRSL